MQWCVLCSCVIIIYHHHSGDHSIICSNLSSSQPGASKHFYQLTDTPSRFSLPVLYSKFCIEVGLLLLTNYHYCHYTAAVVVIVRITCNRTKAKAHSSNQELPSHKLWPEYSYSSSWCYRHVCASRADYLFETRGILKYPLERVNQRQCLGLCSAARLLSVGIDQW